MSHPSQSLATQRPDLVGAVEDFDLLGDERGFIGLRVMPVIEANKQAGIFSRIPLAELLQERDTLRAPGADYAKSTGKFEPVSFATQEHGFVEAVDHREAEQFGAFFDHEVFAHIRAKDVILRNAEDRVATAVLNTATFADTAVGTKWDVSATAVPITDVKAARVAMWEAFGIWANALVISRLVFMDLINTAQIIDRIKASGAGDKVKPRDISERMLAQTLDVDEVIVSGAPKNTANEGAAVALAPIFDKTKALVCKVAKSGDIREPCIGRTIHWAEDGSQIGGTVESWEQVTNRSTMVRVRHDVDEKIITVGAGHILTGVK